MRGRRARGPSAMRGRRQSAIFVLRGLWLAETIHLVLAASPPGKAVSSRSGTSAWAARRNGARKPARRSAGSPITWRPASRIEGQRHTRHVRNRWFPTANLIEKPLCNRQCFADGGPGQEQGWILAHVLQIGKVCC